MAARLLLAIVLLASSLWFLFPTTAYACSCQSYDVTQAVQLYDPIVTGTITTIVYVHDEEPYEFRGETLTLVRNTPFYTFVADEYLTGSRESLLEVRDARGPCGSGFDKGSRYLFHLQRGEDGMLILPACAGSGEITEAYPAQARIDEIRTEAALQGKFEATSFTNDPIPPWATAASLGAAIALGGALLFGVRRLASR